MSSVLYRKVVKNFGALNVLRSLDLAVPDHKFLALLGPSGCGKTTALRILAGLDMPTTGKVFIGERDVTRLQPRDRDIAMVFQSYALYPQMTVAENIGYPLWIRGMPDGKRQAKIDEVAAILEIGHLLDRRPRQLSGGQRQRVALARAIVRDPAAFLMDEPLSNLDARLRLTMRGEIKRLCQRLSATTIYVTHDQVEALTMADLVAVMHGGELQQMAPPIDIYDQPANRFVATFVGNPPMNILPVALSEQGVAAGGSVVPLEGARLTACRLAEIVEIGLRPEDCSIAQPGTPGALPGEIYVVEPMGNETLVNIRVDGGNVSVRAGRDFRGAVGENIGVAFDPSNACFFNSAGLTAVHRVHSNGREK
ncbi:MULTISPECIES: ABC transporter ATP-binding protein [unclassified Mesorhizobium]|uniref:ABC transporter ATP-binding protein n=2 Tax=Mesorhizobium TaxID=68287 RepID=UPI000BAFF7D2|nr:MULTISPECIES: ABC transporter ATP-binding protein [unclassified Mesorhizobium]TGT61240.1 ABC transporter ATP-binding protein [Mesorhizobium sp. M00.F.Ca.ET.170.01.1.1]PBB87619.1 sn-glycerol-3-phosphate ABC transporter ATP-binding protein UgpC [Mesorhizobium sp. WSM3876]RWB74446.1 MAG: ABC transporter ATP-binding protein [Mesorhizobium sp.]RWB84521.1 MAG: ABC transporter ATP-binding protein [Mesorhizobium sp.]RWE27628.1 MAG: ABC transporter ATP-binding protein [Mesorhizobium sp.]